MRPVWARRSWRSTTDLSWNPDIDVVGLGWHLERPGQSGDGLDHVVNVANLLLRLGSGLTPSHQRQAYQGKYNKHLKFKINDR